MKASELYYYFILKYGGKCWWVDGQVFAWCKRVWGSKVDSGATLSKSKCFMQVSGQFTHKCIKSSSPSTVKPVAFRLSSASKSLFSLAVIASFIHELQLYRLCLYFSLGVFRARAWRTAMYSIQTVLLNDFARNSSLSEGRVHSNFQSNDCWLQNISGVFSNARRDGHLLMVVENNTLGLILSGRSILTDGTLLRIDPLTILTWCISDGHGRVQTTNFSSPVDVELP